MQGSCDFQPSDNSRNQYGAVTEKSTGSKTPFLLSETPDLRDEESDTNHCYQGKKSEISMERENLVMEKGHLRRILQPGWIAIAWRAVGTKRTFFIFLQNGTRKANAKRLYSLIFYEAPGNGVDHFPSPSCRPQNRKANERI